jgi:hypothetical protein
VGRKTKAKGMTHDPLCPQRAATNVYMPDCQCWLIDTVRDDEAKKAAARALELPYELLQTATGLRMMVVKEDAIAAAKGYLDGT